MTPDAPARAVPRAVSRLVFAIVMISCAYFVQGAGPNQNSRFGLVRAIVEKRTVSIDAYHDTTWDVAKVGDRFYSDKAPGLALLAVVPYAIGGQFGQPRDELEPRPIVLHFLTLATCSLSTAFAAVVLLELLVALGLALVPSLLAVIGWVLGTNVFAYAGLFLAHQLVASLLVFALAALVAAARTDDERRRKWLLFATGLAGGYAVISEFPAAYLAGALGVFALVTVGRKALVPCLLGGLGPAILLLVYNTLCFGSPLHLGYQSLEGGFAQAVDTGVMGFGPPSLHVLAELTLYEFRGLLPLSPFLVLALPGAVLMIRDPERRRLGILCAAAFLGLLILLSGFFYWNGGAAMGPRHLVPALPFLIIPVAVAIDAGVQRWRRVALGVAAALVGISIAICTICVAVQPEFYDFEIKIAPAPELDPIDEFHPIREFAFPLFETGYVSNKATRLGRLHYASLVEDHDDDAYNLGEAIGLSGSNSLIPLVVIWLGLGLALAWFVRRTAPGPGSSTGRTAADV